MSLKSKCDIQAFTLVEVLVVLAILILLAKQLVGSNLLGWFSQTDYEKLSSAQQSLARGLTIARQYAVQARQTISLCAGDYQDQECEGDWSKGWFIQSEGMIKTYHLFPSGISIIWSGFPATKQQIDFYHTGYSGYQNGTFYLCQFGLMARIVVNQSGRFYLYPVSELSESIEGCK
ncbi:MAG: GspH/FimT family protein [Marinomonas sp.]